MVTRRLHKLWLKVAAVIVGIAGPIFFLAAAGLPAPANLLLDLLDWPIDGGIDLANPSARFLSALTGGFLLGWGVTIWALSGTAYDLAPEAVRKSVVIGLLSWCALDSAGSWLSGNTPNVAFNLLFLALAIGPLWRPAGDLR